MANNMNCLPSRAGEREIEMGKWDGMKEAFRSVVRGLGFWTMLMMTGWFIHEGIPMPGWWDAAFRMMLKFFYDETMNGKKSAPPTP